MTTNVVRWRPRNESPDDLRREHAAAARVGAAFGCECLKLSETLYCVDWALYRDQSLFAFAEFKTRTTLPQVTGDRHFVSAAKFEHGLRLGNSCGVPFLLIVGLPDDDIFYCNCTRLELERVKYIVSGNRKRRQNGDIEPVASLPFDAFKPLPRHA